MLPKQRYANIARYINDYQHIILHKKQDFVGLAFM